MKESIICTNFKSREEALVQIKHWRNDELELRKESECAYDIKADKDDIFRMTWDNDKEILSIGIS